MLYSANITPVMYVDYTGTIAGVDDLTIAGAIILIAILYLAYLAISQAVVEIADAIKTISSSKNKDNYYVYTLMDENNEVFYVGITKNLDNRYKDHKKTYGPDIVMVTYGGPMSESQARVIETGLILQHGSNNIIDTVEFSDNKLHNKIKSISNRRYPGSLLLNKIDSELRLWWEKLGGK